MDRQRSKIEFTNWFLPFLLITCSASSAGSVAKVRANPVLTETKLQFFNRSALRRLPADTSIRVNRASCERSIAPEALATPNPLLVSEPKARIAVSFIIGADGCVHSPIILESAGRNADRSVLDAVLSWRYRPAMCNAEPTDTESKVVFSLQ